MTLYSAIFFANFWCQSGWIYAIVSILKTFFSITFARSRSLGRFKNHVCLDPENVNA